MSESEGVLENIKRKKKKKKKNITKIQLLVICVLDKRAHIPYWGSCSAEPLGEDEQNSPERDVDTCP